MGFMLAFLYGAVCLSFLMKLLVCFSSLCHVVLFLKVPFVGYSSWWCLFAFLYCAVWFVSCVCFSPWCRLFAFHHGAFGLRFMIVLFICFSVWCIVCFTMVPFDCCSSRCRLVAFPFGVLFAFLYGAHFSSWLLFAFSWQFTGFPHDAIGRLWSKIVAPLVIISIVLWTKEFVYIAKSRVFFIFLLLLCYNLKLCIQWILGIMPFNDSSVWYIFSEIQTYFLNINLTEEIGCVTNKTDRPYCYIYQPIRLLKQYLNPNTRYYLEFRDRLTINGVSSSFEPTREIMVLII